LFSDSLLERLEWDKENKNNSEAAEHVYMTCPNNGCVIEQDKKKWMNKHGKWIKAGQSIDVEGVITGTALKSSYASFWLHGCAASDQSWNDLVLKYLQAEAEYQATGNEQLLKTTTNVDQASPYKLRKASSDRNPNELMTRAETFNKHKLPLWVRFLTASIDLQKESFVVQVQGWGVGLECIIIDRFTIRWSNRMVDGERQIIDPAAYHEDWQVLIEQVINKTYQFDHNSKLSLPVMLTACDSGGQAGVTHNAYQFYRHIKHCGLAHKFILVKGQPRYESPTVKKSYPDSGTKTKANANGEIPLYMLNVNLLKDRVSSDLDRKETGSRYVHFPDWIGSWFYSELTAEYRTEKG
jgi:phage terminase large subunit GpA-like protein